MNTTQQMPEEWWGSLPRGERKFIWTLMRMIGSAKKSQFAEVARAAQKWGPGIACFIKVRLINSRRHARRCVPVVLAAAGWLDELADVVAGVGGGLL